MAFYDGLFNIIGLRDWCDAKTSDVPMSMSDLLAKTRGESVADSEGVFPFPSLDAINKACSEIPRTREMTAGVENAFLNIKDSLKVVLDPITQPLSWFLDGALYAFTSIPWFILIPMLVLCAWYISKSLSVTLLVMFVFLGFGFIDHLNVAIQTLSIVFVCTTICVLFGVPIGILMSKSNAVQRVTIPILDLLQTLPSFVYLIPLIFLFSVTESKLYGIAIILYAIVPVIRLTNLGIRLVDRDVIEAANAFGMSSQQKLLGVEIPLALPNIMAGVNQTIMMSLSMVVIASLVSAPGLGVLVLRGIRNLELGVGLIAGLGIVLLAVVLDRTTKAALSRINKSHCQDK